LSWPTLGRRAREDLGYTLTELVLVLVIIGILAGIAIPVYLGYTAHAQNRSAQTSLRITLSDASGLFERYGSFDGPFHAYQSGGQSGQSGLVVALSKFEPALSFTTRASDGPKQVSLEVVSPNILVLAALALDHQCWFAKDDLQPSKKGGILFGTRKVGSNCIATQWRHITNWTTKL